MNKILDELAAFARSRLVPAARACLMRAYNAYCQGDDLGAALKEDGTPASRADRDTERLLREMIAEAYPDHGIAGEEYGVENADAEFIWVLDPLDGTKEFLAKVDGWGILIGLLQKGKPVLGSIIDPQTIKIWDQDTKFPVANVKSTIEQAIVATTAPENMFRDAPYAAGAQALFRRCAGRRERLNCLGFAYAADGCVDVVAENRLTLYDIAALLPVLWAAGATCRNLSGADYRNIAFDVGEAAAAHYGLVASRDPSLVSAVLTTLQGD
ncbi:MAG: inositol monophosphatase family protein [Alphaproteobacteria bacterium]|nr:inositol monophosphatase family protein [Alphaproteobacteria bacterium]